MIFAINNTDYSANVIAGSYKVNSKDVYEEWTDASHSKHRRLLKTRVSGSFDMFFRTEAEFIAFDSTVRANMDARNSVPVKLAVNGYSTAQDVNVFIDYEVTRDIDGNLSDYFHRFTIKVEGR